MVLLGRTLPLLWRVETARLLHVSCFIASLFSAVSSSILSQRYQSPYLFVNKSHSFSQQHGLCVGTVYSSSIYNSVRLLLQFCYSTGNRAIYMLRLLPTHWRGIREEMVNAYQGKFVQEFIAVSFKYSRFSTIYLFFSPS